MVKLQVYASLLVFTLATSSALAVPMLQARLVRKGILPQRDIDKEFFGREYLLDERDTYSDLLEARRLRESVHAGKKNVKNEAHRLRESIHAGKKNVKNEAHRFRESIHAGKKSVKNKLRPGRKTSKNLKHPLDGLDLDMLEEHMVKTAGILWGLRRRDLDAEPEELFQREYDDLD